MSLPLRSQSPKDPKDPRDNGTKKSRRRKHRGRRVKKKVETTGVLTDSDGSGVQLEASPRLNLQWQLDDNSGMFLSLREEVALANTLLSHEASQTPSSESEGYQVGTFAQQFNLRWKTQLPEPVGRWKSSNNSLPLRNPFDESIEQIIHAEIGRLRLVNFEVYRLHVIFWPASTSKSVYQNGLSEIKFFNFLVDNDTPHLVPVQVIQRVEETHIVVKFHGKWESLESYLVSIVPFDIADPEYKAQYHFWHDNGLKFRLFDLPLEIREIIYLHALLPMTGCRPRVVYPYRYHRYPTKDDHVPSTFAPNLNLLRANRAVNKEATLVVYREAEFSFRKVEGYSNFILRHWQAANTYGFLAQTYFSRVRRIHLSFTHLDFLRFFGANLSFEVYYDASPVARWVLRQRIPFEWVAIHISPPSHLVNSKGVVSRLWDEDMGCHKKIVDWILLYVEQYFGYLGRERIHLGGCVKHSQMDKFSARLRKREECEERKERRAKSFGSCDKESAQGGVSLEGYEDVASFNDENAVEKYEQDEGAEDKDSDEEPDEYGFMSVDIPPICECATHCSLETFTPDD
ncbi:hypothetical protein NA57DRAFT_52238 [Rhizodiscina lignyota]|uniref:Uncharacterized protein n=1 Tax=Rhizodiscina lignyota TaxID=1504668 RepID=A0A9P4INE0_9PEZI|nr:hypothetical protein NA57DRAFT_52238 [Rhizodiscina lignyota]